MAKTCMMDLLFKTNTKHTNMKTFGANVPIGLGDLIYMKAMFDPVKDSFSEINLNFHREGITLSKKDDNYNVFLDDLGNLLFGQEPYKIDTGNQYPYCRLAEVVTSYGITPQKPELADILCSGTSLSLDEPYIVINTKVRALERKLLNGKMPEFWTCLLQLVKKYKVVILGERAIEMNGEYIVYTNEFIYSLYPEIIKHVPTDRLIDLTVPALGITSPILSQIQQDCLIMNQAEFVINFGIGGGFCLASAVANLIGYRYDDDFVADCVFENKVYDNATVTKNWNTFISKIRTYL
jgi:hypothetical protein